MDQNQLRYDLGELLSYFECTSPSEAATSLGELMCSLVYQGEHESQPVRFKQYYEMHALREALLNMDNQNNRADGD